MVANIMLPMILYNMTIAGYLSRRDDEEDETPNAPGGFAAPDDQGPLDTCTRFALSN